MNTKNSKKIISTRVFAAIIVISMLALSAATASAATEDEIRQAIGNGTAYLGTHQNAGGSWGTDSYAAVTGMVLLKLQEHATELGKDPYDNNPASPRYYEYADEVTAGMDYLLSTATIRTLSGAPDTNNNGQGIAFASGTYQETYTTGIALCALMTSTHLDDRSYTLSDGNSYTYGQIAQDVADWLAYGQIDSGTGRGGWRYQAVSGSGTADNSNSGYATLGLGYANAGGCTVPQFVMDELSIWIDYIQGDVSGGSGYTAPNDWGVNILKTGNLLQQMHLCGDAPGVPRVDNAIGYIENNWHAPNNMPGWGYGYACPLADYQAMFCAMKGLVSMEIDLLDLNGSGVADNDWFNQEPPADPPEDFATVIVDQQNNDGSWSCGGVGYCGGGVPMCTAWALLTLEKFIPLDPWAEINEELDVLIEKVDAAGMPNIIKRRLIDKLVYAKALKDNAHEECLAGNFDAATKKLGVAKNQVESFASMVKITRRISPEDKASFLADATEIIGKIDELIEHIENTHSC